MDSMLRATGKGLTTTQRPWIVTMRELARSTTTAEFAVDCAVAIDVAMSPPEFNRAETAFVADAIAESVVLFE